MQNDIRDQLDEFDDKKHITLFLFQLLIDKSNQGDDSDFRLHRNIRIKSANGHTLVHLRENVTMLNSKKFKVNHKNGRQVRVGLVDPPAVFEPADQPLEDREDLPVSWKHTLKRGGKPYKMHR